MQLNAYQKTAITTVLATLFLIFVGGLVRATGAGLGCPDWPKCFGTWIPPTSLADLPAEFDASQFNVVKTWTEYINRLIGVVIGLLITATFLLSVRYRKTKPDIFYSSVAAFVLVIFQAWLGGQVVKSGLAEYMITLHMILALVIMNVLLYATFRATKEFVEISLDKKHQKVLIRISLVLIAVTMIQLVLGTQVREEIDLIKEAAMVPDRSSWLERVGEVFKLHRSFSWIVMITGLYLGYYIKKEKIGGLVAKIGFTNIGLIILQILIGAGLQLSMPKPLQVIHLVGIAVMVSAQFLLILIIRLRTTNQSFSSN